MPPAACGNARNALPVVGLAGRSPTVFMSSQSWQGPRGRCTCLVRRRMVEAHGRSYRPPPTGRCLSYAKLTDMSMDDQGSPIDGIDAVGLPPRQTTWQLIPGDTAVGRGRSASRSGCEPTRSRRIPRTGRALAARAGSRARKCTVAPRRASSMAAARPSPEVAPVTSATPCMYKARAIGMDALLGWRSLSEHAGGSIRVRNCGFSRS